jgi:hypothetical protein
VISVLGLVITNKGSNPFSITKKKYIIMEEISKMSLADKIIILNEVKKNFSILKKTWTTAKVQWLDVHVLAELQKLGDFKY